jgi:hypothetical protein
MLFAHLKRILKLDWLRLRGPNGGAINSTSPPPPRTFRKLGQTGSGSAGAGGLTKYPSLHRWLSAPK